MEPKKLLLKTLIKTLTATSTVTLNEPLVSRSLATKVPNKKWQVFTEDSKTKATASKPVQKEFKTVFTEDSKTKATASKPVQKGFKTVQWSEDIRNTASFIGRVSRPVQRFESPYSKTSKFGAATSLDVESSNSTRSFRVLLKMWDEMAEMSLEHIKQNDFIHVSGNVESYTKTDENNKSQTFYEVVVKEINYVAESEHSPTGKIVKEINYVAESEHRPTGKIAEPEPSPTSKIAEPEHSSTGKIADKIDSKGGVSWAEKDRARLRLWQLFFTNPSEWYDNRKTKPKPTYPDFKNKNTGEALWMSARDPPWVKKQLQLVDSKHTKQDHKEDASSTFSPFV